MREQAVNKTTICSVVFLDIVEYSKRSVAEQIKLKNQFNALISLAIRNVPVTDRIILDTGDGAAISFLGDPEDALMTAMKLRDAVLGEQNIPFVVRIGINLGPVRLVQDINKQPNIIGDGINVAQRVMNFAKPNQILVSRSFYDVISYVTDDYAKLFEYQGSRTDKHVREHEIYAVRNEVGQEDALRASFKHTHPHVREKLKTHWWNDRKVLLKMVFPSAAILLILLAVLVKVVHEPEKRMTAQQLSTIPPSPLPQSAPLSTPAPIPVLPKPAPATAKQLVPAKSEVTALRKKQEGVPVETSTLLFRVLPWGEIYVDGKKRGVSPPLKSLKVDAGKHKIELRNSTLPSHTQTVETAPGERVIIRHQF